MASVLFYPRKKTGKTTVLVKVDLGRYKSFVLSSRVSLGKVEEEWSERTKRPKDPGKRKLIDALDANIRKLFYDAEVDLKRSLYDLESKDFQEVIYNVHNVPNKLRKYKETKEDLLSIWIGDFISNCEKRGFVGKDGIKKMYSEGTLRKYKQLKRTVEAYDEENGKTYLGSCDRKWVNDFDSYLSDNFSISTAGRKLKSLKTVLGAAQESGKRVDEYWRSIKGYSVSTTVVPLYEEEQELIFVTPMPSKELEWAKDWLLLLCGTGQRFSDINRLTLDNITKDGYINIIQQKTGNQVNIPLFDRVKRILDKYKGTPPKYSDKPSTQNAMLNRYIKEVCKVCGIDEVVKDVTHNGKKGDYKKYELIMTKTGRKSMASYLYKNLKWDAQSCQRISGHLSLDSFFIYVGGRNSEIDEKNKERVEELNKETVQKRSKNLRIG